MDTIISDSREQFIQGMSRISQFWGFPRGMGSVYGAIYLSPQPVSLDDLVLSAGVSKGAVSTHVRHLERLGMVHKHVMIGDRRDFYSAETDFWKMIKNILLEREKSEFAQALDSVSESLAALPQVPPGDEQAELVAFYRQRLEAMQAFFHTLDQLVATVLALDGFRMSAFQKLVKRAGKGEE